MLKNIIFSLILVFMLFSVVQAQDTGIRDIYFPTDKTVTFKDDFGSARGSDRTHEANDLMGPKMTPLYSAVDGFINYITIPEASYGYMLVIEDAEGWTYGYIHINNDTPGTDDGAGGIENAFAEGIKEGAKVTRGQLVGWMGDSGNAEEIASHLHFEIRRPNGTAINPYESLIKSLGVSDSDMITFSLQKIIASSPNINDDKNLKARSETNCVSNTVFKIETADTLYYCGSNGKRYVFPNEKIYFSWFEDFDEVKVIDLEDISKIALAGNVTYKPGVRMIKVTTDPKVYLVDKGGVLRWLESEQVAIALYGDDWSKSIDDLPDAYFFDYEIGESIAFEDL